MMEETLIVRTGISSPASFPCCNKVYAVVGKEKKYCMSICLLGKAYKGNDGHPGCGDAQKGLYQITTSSSKRLAGTGYNWRLTKHVPYWKKFMEEAWT